MFDPIRIASEWHGGQWSALYKLSCNGRVLGPNHRADLLSEIWPTYNHVSPSLRRMRAYRELRTLYRWVKAWGWKLDE
jgi:hypothetical protein